MFLLLATQQGMIERRERVSEAENHFLGKDVRLSQSDCHPLMNSSGVLIDKHIIYVPLAN